MPYLLNAYISPHRGPCDVIFGLPSAIFSAGPSGRASLLFPNDPIQARRRLRRPAPFSEFGLTLRIREHASGLLPSTAQDFEVLARRTPPTSRRQCFPRYLAPIPVASYDLQLVRPLPHWSNVRRTASRCRRPQWGHILKRSVFARRRHSQRRQGLNSIRFSFRANDSRREPAKSAHRSSRAGLTPLTEIEPFPMIVLLQAHDATRSTYT